MPARSPAPRRWRTRTAHKGLAGRTVWASAADQSAFQSSPAYGPFLQSLRSLADPDSPAGVETARLVSPEVELSAALDAPCTEVFTAYGAEPAFPGAVAAFAAGVAAAPPPAYRGAAVCDSAGEIEGLGRVVKLVVGWESREAHLEAKGKPGRELYLLFVSPCLASLPPFGGSGRFMTGEARWPRPARG